MVLQLSTNGSHSSWVSIERDSMTVPNKEACVAQEANVVAFTSILEVVIDTLVVGGDVVLTGYGKTT